MTEKYQPCLPYFRVKVIVRDHSNILVLLLATNLPPYRPHHYNWQTHRTLPPLERGKTFNFGRGAALDDEKVESCGETIGNVKDKQVTDNTKEEPDLKEFVVVEEYIGIDINNTDVLLKPETSEIPAENEASC